MAVQQQSKDTNEQPARPTLGRSLLWPAAAVGMGILLIYNAVDPVTDGKSAAPPALSAPSSTATAPPEVLRAGLPRSEPTRLKIAHISVDAPFTPLSIGASGRLDPPPPDDTNLVGWWREGVTPGEKGTAIVAGHVDTKTGPAVFAQLSELKRGMRVDLVRKDGSVATFEVDEVDNFSKSDFPDDRVYADTPDPQLRLITCGGEYDKKAKDYKENVVVFAHLASATTKS
ncbi:class F sortase [Streptomyces sp. NPDC006283]|uniref:class F sortase n=1 Tax=Streptomyces sp. NPDC006283 TaxID=3156741 RepID=UPI0033BF2145